MMGCLNKFHCENELIFWLFLPKLDLHRARSSMDKRRFNEWDLNVVIIDVVTDQLFEIELIRIACPLRLCEATS